MSFLSQPYVPQSSKKEGKQPDTSDQVYGSSHKSLPSPPSPHDDHGLSNPGWLSTPNSQIHTATASVERGRRRVKSGDYPPDQFSGRTMSARGYDASPPPRSPSPGPAHGNPLRNIRHERAYRKVTRLYYDYEGARLRNERARRAREAEVPCLCSIL